MKPRSRAQDRALLRALNRGEPFHLFPMPLRGDAGGLVAGALVRRGLATDEPAPVLTALGIREAHTILAKVDGTTPAGARSVVNCYRCPDCGEAWEDEWSCACDDTCPGCGLKDIEPLRSEQAPNAREGAG